MRCAWLRVVAGRSVSAMLSGSLMNFQRAGALFHAAQEAAFLQRRDQAVDAGLGLEVQRVLHLVEGGRNAAFAHPLMDEHQKFVLLAGQHRFPPKFRAAAARHCAIPDRRTNPKHGELFYFSS